jgi:hypothetical protein
LTCNLLHPPLAGPTYPTKSPIGRRCAAPRSCPSPLRWQATPPLANPPTDHNHAHTYDLRIRTWPGTGGAAGGRVFGGGKGGGAKEVRAGDWMCPSCNNHNFASRTECRRCGLSKARNEAATASQAAGGGGGHPHGGAEGEQGGAQPHDVGVAGPFTGRVRHTL